MSRMHHLSAIALANTVAHVRRSSDWLTLEFDLIP